MGSCLQRESELIAKQLIYLFINVARLGYMKQ